MGKKAIPIGIENFEDTIKDNYYYVDKSMLIEDILVNRAAVTLFTIFLSQNFLLFQFPIEVLQQLPQYRQKFF